MKSNFTCECHREMPFKVPGMPATARERYAMIEGTRRKSKRDGGLSEALREYESLAKCLAVSVAFYEW